jgi:hypothetical protein
MLFLSDFQIKKAPSHPTSNMEDVYGFPLQALWLNTPFCILQLIHSSEFIKLLVVNASTN